MASQPDPPPDKIDPQTPDEFPDETHPVEEPIQQPDEIEPVQPDHDNPGRGPIETPPPPD